MFDVQIKFRVCSEAGHVIHLQDPRFELMIKHHVEAQQVAANIGLLGLTRPIQMLQLWLDDVHRFDYDLLNLSPDSVSSLPIHLLRALLAQLTLKDVSQSQLVLFVIEVGSVLVEAVVSQMDEGIVKIGSWIVLL